MAYLTAAPLDLDAMVQEVASPGHGATAAFIGTVRDNHQGRTVVGLEYSAYGPMAEAVCAAIVTEAEARWPVRMTLAHRVGALLIGEASVIVAAGSAHREAALSACRWAIEEVKARAPIWKRERYADGTEAWVDPTRGVGVTVESTDIAQ